MDANTIIEKLGGTSRVAKMCDVSSPAVSQWRKKGIPRTTLKYMQVLRPDVFDELAQADGKLKLG